MIYHILDRQFNPLTFIDTESDEGIMIENDVHAVGLTNNTLLNTLSMDIIKNSGEKIGENYNKTIFETALIKESVYIVFQNEKSENICLYVRAIESEDEDVRTISCVDIGVELRNGSASIFNSNKAQHIDYYVNRELVDSGWVIGVNEIGADIKRLVDTSSDETPLSRLQKTAEAFGCEMTFTVDFQNMKVTNKKINIVREIGADRTDSVLYSGVDVISMNKSVDIDNVITAIQDTNNGFDKLSEGDGRFFTARGESIIYDRESNAIYGQGNTSTDRFNGFILGSYASSNKTPIENYNELRAILEERSQPTFSAEVDMLFNDGDFEVGDWLTFIDEEYNPPLRIKARVLSKELNRSKQTDNKAVIGNYQLLESMISSDLIAKQQEMNKPSSVYSIKLISDNGTGFIDGQEKKTKIKVIIYKDGIDVTDDISDDELVWFKVSKDGTHDEAWESSNANAGKYVEITTNDINEVASIRCTLTIFDNHYVQAIYFINGLKDVARKVLRAQNENTITSIHISDTHYATDSITRDDLENYGRSNNHLKNVAELTHFIPIDYAVLNGDVHDGSTANKNIAVSNYTAAVNTLGLLDCPYFITRGNHCSNSWGDSRTSSINKPINNYKHKTQEISLHGKQRQTITPNEMYQISTKPSTIFNIVENPTDKNGYYYYDVPNKKQRMIVLNTQDVPHILDTDGYAKYIDINVAGYRQEQISWLYDVLKNTPSDTAVTIYQHHPFGERYSQNLKYYPYNYEMIEGIINSFVSGGKYSREYTENSDFKASISCDFEGRKGTLAFLAHGHVHADKITTDSNGITNYSIGCSVSRPKKDQKDRPIGELSEDLWDVVVIDTKKRNVDLIRFGKGKDRSFKF